MSAAGCWRRIGVYGGDRSCPELAAQVHCRNCPVFAQSARNLLARPNAALPLAALPEARRPSVEQEGTVLTFDLGGEWLGLDAALVAEVADLATIRRIAHRNGGHVEGLVNLRGELHLCVNLTRLLGLETDDTGGRMILLRHGDDAAWAFRARRVSGLTRFRESELLPPPATLRAQVATHVRAILPRPGQHLVLLDGEQVLKSLASAIYA